MDAALAERLDAVLGIAERLAASHEREDLFRTIVDETLRALRVDYVTIRLVLEDRLVVVGLGGARRTTSPGRCRRSGSTRRGPPRSCATGRVSAWSDARLDPRHAAERYPVLDSPAISSRR